MTKLIWAAVLGTALTLTASGAEALPLAPRVETPANEIIQVRGGCGLGWHRGPWGGCRLNGVPYVYGPYAYAAPPPYARCWWRPTVWGPRRVCGW